MKVNVKVNIDCKKILQSRGLDKNGAAARHLANLVAITATNGYRSRLAT